MAFSDYKKTPIRVYRVRTINGDATMICVNRETLQQAIESCANRFGESLISVEAR